uniref:Uncharacterized protein n=1 Tax=Marinobacter nauticus TaxID=2743 RepID=A0A455W0W3_MARNT|nr:hypothetical protein YBY_02390 [Marinobacter nauticus]
MGVIDITPQLFEAGRRWRGIGGMGIRVVALSQLTAVPHVAIHIVRELRWRRQKQEPEENGQPDNQPYRTAALAAATEKDYDGKH